MKKFLSIIALVLALSLLLCSCGKKADDKKDESDGTDKVTDSATKEPAEDKETEKPSENEDPKDTDSAPSEPEAPVMTEEYKKILTALAGAFPWSYDNVFLVPGHEEMSYIYVQYPEMDGIGYTLYDIDNNGTNELIIASMDTGFIADVYTMKDNKAVHLFAGHQRNHFEISESGMIKNFWQGAAAVAGYDYYTLTDGEMVLNKRITLDGYYAVENGHVATFEDVTGENCWFISDTMEYKDYVYVTNGLANSTVEEYDEKMGTALTLDLTPLSEITK